MDPRIEYSRCEVCKCTLVEPTYEVSVHTSQWVVNQFFCTREHISTWLNSGNKTKSAKRSETLADLVFSCTDYNPSKP